MRTLYIGSSNDKVSGWLTEVLECRGFLNRHIGLGVVLDSQPTTSPAVCEVWTQENRNQFRGTRGACWLVLRCC